MADYAPNHTGRFRIRYATVGQTHAMTFRYFPDGQSLDGLRNGIGSFLDALASIRFNDWTVIGADAAGVNSDIFLPVAPPVVAAGEAPPPLTSVRPLFGSFNGRSTLGSKARVYIYGINQIPTGNAAYLTDYRILGPELAAVASAVTALNAIPGQAAIDRGDVTFYPYMNIALNAYYQRKMRG